MPSTKNTPALRQGCRSVNQLLYIQHFCHLVEDFGVIVVTVELVSVDTISQDSNRQAGVAVRGEGDTGLIVQNMSQRNGQRIVGAVHHILSLSVNTSLSTVTLTHILNNKSGISFTSYSHTGLPVAVLAEGVNAEVFNGYYDNTDIFNKLAEMLNVQ